MRNKLGQYIQKLMTTILDTEQDEFVIELAHDELTRLKVDVEKFLSKHEKDDDEGVKNTTKILLQEQQENKNVK